MQLSLFASESLNMTLATVDSGFGGYFTAKALEQEAQKLGHIYDANFSIKHYGDTLNAPYGEKSPDQIAQLATQMIIKAHEAGAKHVFLACNTASSQFEKIQELLRKNEKTNSYVSNTYSIIESSVVALKNTILALSKNSKNDIHIALLVTPATLKTDIYPERLQKAFAIKEINKSEMHFVEQKRWRTIKSKSINSAYSKLSFPLNNNQNIFLYQLAPANWVEMIEYLADEKVKNEVIKRDLTILTDFINQEVKLDIVAHFCTHFPVFDKEIKKELSHLRRVKLATTYMQQGEIFAKAFAKIFEQQKPVMKKNKMNTPQLSPEIFISGDNKVETEKLVRTIFPEQKTIKVSILK